MADVNVTIGADATQADQQVEAFFRKIEGRKVNLNLEGSWFQADPSTAGGRALIEDYRRYNPRELERMNPWLRESNPRDAGSTATVEPVVREAIVRRAESERKVTAANERLATATVAAAGGAAGSAAAGGGAFGQGAIHPRGRVFGLPLGSLGSVATLGTVLHAGMEIGEAFLDRERETRLAIGARGGEDSLRRMKAELAFREQVSNVFPLGIGKAGAAINELIFGDVEYSQGMSEKAQRQAADDARRTARRAIVDQGRESLYRSAEQLYPHMGTTDPLDVARRTAEAQYRGSVRANEIERSKVVGAESRPEYKSELEAQFKELEKGLGVVFDKTTRNIAVQQRFRTREIEDDIAVSDLVGKRQPLSAQAEAIYRRGTLTAAQLHAQGREGDERLELQLARSQLLAFKATAFNGGTAQEVAAGAFGPQGTQGTDQAGADYSAALGRIEQLLQKLDASLNALGGTP